MDASSTTEADQKQQKKRTAENVEAENEYLKELKKLKGTLPLYAAPRASVRFVHWLMLSTLQLEKCGTREAASSRSCINTSICHNSSFIVAVAHPRLLIGGIYRFPNFNLVDLIL